MRVCIDKSNLWTHVTNIPGLIWSSPRATHLIAT
jgi:hypothetical protein